MGKRYRILVTILSGVMLMTGCAASPQLNLTNDEEQKIVGYASDLLLKYNKSHNEDLVDTTEARKLAAKVELLKEKHKAEQQEAKQSDGAGKSQKLSEDGTEVSGTQDIAEALGLTGFQITYSDYEVCATYPNNGTTDEYFNMAATQGKELLVFHFSIQNESDTDAVCDILDGEPVLRMLINGTERKNVLTTLLLDDIATINETIPGGSSIGAVAILEVPEGYESEISSVDFSVKCGEMQSTIAIQ